MFGLPIGDLITYLALGLVALACIVYVLAYIAGKAVIHARLHTLMKAFSKTKEDPKGDES